MKFTVSDVHCLKQAKYCLLSISSLCDEFDASFAFERYSGTMKLNIDGIVEEIPLIRRNNLYYLEWAEGLITDPLRYMKTER